VDMTLPLLLWQVPPAWRQVGEAMGGRQRGRGQGRSRVRVRV
jgi:hypothetical protein